MADENTTDVDTETDTETKPPTTTSTTTSVTSDDPIALKAELERTKAALAKSNKEMMDRRHKIEEFERQEEERKAAQMTEADRQKKQTQQSEQRAKEAETRAAALELALNRTRIDTAVERYALDADFQYPDVVPQLIDRDLIEVDPETGRVDKAKVKAAVDRLAKERPGLLNSSTRGGSPPREGPRRSLNVNPGAGGGGQAGARTERLTIKEEMLNDGNYVT